MISIRRGVFETNSSSTHSICICTQDEFEKWRNGEMVYDYYSDKIKPMPEGFDPDDDRDNRYRSFDYEDWYLEYYEEHFTTPSGDNMVVFGWYGRDG